MNERTEDTVLRLAVSRGHLSQADFERLTSRVSGRPPSLDALVGEGVLEASTVSVLREEVRRSSESADEWPVPHWDRYRLLAFAGQGATGRVYKALDLRLNHVVALKFLLGQDPALLERFRREAQAQARVEHPNICPVHDVGVVEGHHYIAMQFVDGVPLRAAARSMSLEQKLRVIRDVAEALHEAHRAGLIHRDVKPGNIMVEHSPDRGWRPVVVDFGLARDTAALGMTMSGVVIGTPQFMSPEQARGRVHTLDRRTDVYGLGATLYAILTDHPPFEGTSMADIARQVIQDPPRAPRLLRADIPRDVESITMKCLRKNPAERYGSARELAEDLDRYLDGEPVEAHRTALLYRLRLRAAKYKLEVATLAIALVLLAAIGGWGVRQKWKSARVSELARSFGQQVERVEALARSAVLTPLHDTRPERERIRALMAQLEQRVEEIGDLAVGPGHYALGRGHLALGEIEVARSHLQTAWDRGYREPQTAYALALVLGRLGQEALRRTDFISGQEQRDAERRRIEEEYRLPALRYLQAGAGGETENPSYVEALMAFHRRDYEEALGKARAAFEGRPWFYEAKQLEGEIRMEVADNLAAKGDLDGATAAFRGADAVFDEAVAVGSSDADLYVALGTLQLWRMMAEIGHRGSDVGPFFRRGLDALDRALIALPGDVEALNLRSDLHRRMGEYRMSRGEDPTEHFLAAVRAAEQSLEVLPEGAEALSHLGSAYRQIGKHEQSRGHDPGESYTKAIRAYEAARAIDPASVEYSSLGILFKTQAQWLMGRGEDPRPALESALSVLEQGRAILPRNVAMLNNLGNTYSTLAEYQLSVGEDPGESLAKAADAFRAGLEINAEHPILLYGLGLNLNQQAQLALRHGGDPGPFLDEALDAYARAIAINPQSNWLAYFHTGRGFAYAFRLRFELSRGRDPTESYRSAAEEFHLALTANASHIFACVELADTEIAFAEFEHQLGRDTGTHLQEAIRWARAALRIDATSADALTSLAEAHRLRADELVDRGSDPRGLLEKGRAAANKAREINPRSALSFEALGRLATLEGRWRVVEGEDPTPAYDKARADLEESVRLDPDNVAAYVALLELCRRVAEHHMVAGLPLGEQVTEGLDAAERALAVWPGHAETCVLRAVLLSQQGLTERDVDRAAALFRRADESMQEGVTRNGHLRGPYAEEAEVIRRALARA